MKVRLSLNIGTADAPKYGLKSVGEGDLADVTEAAGSDLINRGWATLVAEPTPEPKPAIPATLKAVTDQQFSRLPKSDPLKSEIKAIPNA